MCTVFKLYPSKLVDIKCEGVFSTLSDLAYHDSKFFIKHNINVKENTTIADLVINKLTPESVEINKLTSVDICESHMKMLAYNHKSLRQTLCPVLNSGGSNCGKKGEAPTRPRVSFEVATLIYQMTNQHVLVGTTLCPKHRKQFTPCKKELLEENEEDKYASDGVTVDEEDSKGGGVVADDDVDNIVEQTGPKMEEVLGIPRVIITPNRKRKSFLQAVESIPKLVKHESETSSAGAQSQPMDSQGSNFSLSSEIVMNRTQENFNKLIMCLVELDPSQADNISQPFDLTVPVHKKTVNSYARKVGNVWKLILETVTFKSDEVSLLQSNNFLSSVIKAVDCKTDEPDKIKLALNVLESLKDYYGMACSDSTRGSIATRKQLLQAVTGEPVRQANQLSALAEAIGARRSTLEKEAENREKIEEKDEIIPFMKTMKRKCPEGSRIVSDEERLEAVSFYELDHISDLLKGHNNIMREILVNDDGSKFVFLRPKRVLKVHLCELLQLAKKEIGFKYSLNTLMGLRPRWILLAKEAHCLTCLCDRCANIQLILRSISKFVQKTKKHGSPVEKAALLGFEISSSISEFLARVLHPKEEGQEWHPPECYEQGCLSTLDSPCGSDKLAILFSPLLKYYGSQEIQLFQHLRVSYQKADGSNGSKMDQVESRKTISNIVELLDSRVFGNFHKQPYIQHRLKMLLGTRMRQDVHNNLGVRDLACYTDYSKEYEALDQERCKSSAFGAGNVTIQLIGQIFEMKVLPPSQPTSVSFDDVKQRLSFSSPDYDGGSRIQFFEIHIKSEFSSTWQMLSRIEVLKLSPEPDIPSNIFGRLGGRFMVRIFARSLIGLGAFAEIDLLLGGDLPLMGHTEGEISASHYELSHATFYVEHFFFSDHYDAPKDWRTILKCKELALEDIKIRFNRSFDRLISISDTGGENNGSTALCCYSFSETDFGMESIWAPTAAHHSGQLSDSSCGTLKRCLKNDLKAGKALFLNNADKVVKYCQDQPLLREVSQAKYLRAKTVHRSYHHITKDLVVKDDKSSKRREVVCLAGISKLKQVWSVGEHFSLKVRNHTCCCSSCMNCDFENCDIKDYTDRPQVVHFTPVRPTQTPTLRRNFGSFTVGPEIQGGEVEETEGLSETCSLESGDKEVDDTESETCNLVAEPGKVYVILGDSFEGYYVVKCTETFEDTFSGKYFKEVPDLIIDQMAFKQMKDADIFFTNCIVAELEVIIDEQKNMTKFLATKFEMDEILIKVVEMKNI